MANSQSIQWPKAKALRAALPSVCDQCYRAVELTKFINLINLTPSPTTSLTCPTYRRSLEGSFGSSVPSALTCR